MAQMPKSDVKSDTEGRWFEYALGIEVKVSRMGNPAFQTHIRNLAKRRARGVTQEDMTKSAVAHTIVTDWKNLSDDNDEAVPYSAEKCLEFFHDPDYYDFYRWVLSVAGDEDEWGIDVDAGNSSTS